MIPTEEGWDELFFLASVSEAMWVLSKHTRSSRYSKPSLHVYRIIFLRQHWIHQLCKTHFMHEKEKKSLFPCCHSRRRCCYREGIISLHVTNPLRYLNSQRSLPSKTYNFALQKKRKRKERKLSERTHENCEFMFLFHCWKKRRICYSFMEHKSLVRLQPLSSEQTRKRWK